MDQVTRGLIETGLKYDTYIKSPYVFGEILSFSIFWGAIANKTLSQYLREIPLFCAYLQGPEMANYGYKVSVIDFYIIVFFGFVLFNLKLFQGSPS